MGLVERLLDLGILINLSFLIYYLYQAHNGEKTPTLVVLNEELDRMWSGKFCNNDTVLQYDQACLNIVSGRPNLGGPIDLYVKTEDCYKCDYTKWVTLPQNGTTSLLVSTTYRLQFYLKDRDAANCRQSFLFEQHGRYGWNISEYNCSSIYTASSPDNAYLPLYGYSLLIFLAISCKFLFVILKKINCVLRDRGISAESDEEILNSDNIAPMIQSELIPDTRRVQRSRIMSLDTFRGIAIVMMIFCNYGGGQYSIFKHSSWNGLSVADVIFPWFAWIMGVGIVLSVRSQLRSGRNRSQIIGKAFARMFKLILLGIFCSNFNHNNFSQLRIPGVLQRLGISYFFVTVLEVTLMKRQPNFQYGKWVVIQDILDSWVQWVVVILITLSHTFITFHLDVPACPTGYLGPGGWHDHSSHFNCTGGASGYIDRLVFGSNHIYQHPTSRRVYHTTVPFDPEGLLGVLTTILTVYLGVAAGRVILCCNSTSSRVKRWICYALVCGVIGGYLCGWSKEEGLIPINKNLWSLSFVCVTASLAFIMLAVLFLIVDHWAPWSDINFAKAGMNAIVLFVGHELTKNTFPWSWSPVASRETHTEFLCMNIIGTALWCYTAVVMANKDFYVTI